MARYFEVAKEDVSKVRYYGQKWDYEIKVFPITNMPRYRKIQAKYFGRGDLPSKMKNSKGFNSDLKKIKTFLVG